MGLTDDKRQSIREEEQLRDEVRKELAGQKPRSRWQKLNDFLESKVGFWLLATVLTGLFTTGYSYLQVFIHRHEVERQKEIDDTRRDADLIIKIGPMLGSPDSAQIKVASILLTGLSEHRAIDAVLAGQVSDLVASILRAGQNPNATKEERDRANILSATLDNGSRTGVAAAAQNGAPAAAPAQTPVTSIVDTKTLPVRIYIQIGKSADLASAKTATGALRQAGFIVPAIEQVELRNAPSVTSVRFCPDKVGGAALQQVKEAMKALTPPVETFFELKPFQCGNVRYNHFELWYAAK